MKNNIVIITGMHRSCTSLVTQWLQHCGLFVGEQLLGADTGNDDGHFEDLDFLQLHEAFLFNRGTHTTGLISHSLAPLTTAELEQLQQLVERRNNTHETWGWKEPRTCLFLDAYRTLAAGALYVVIFRDYRAVVASLLNRMHKDKCIRYAKRKGIRRFIWDHFRKGRYLRHVSKKYAAEMLQVWIRYNEAIIAHLAVTPADHYIVVSDEALYGNSREVFAVMQQRWALPLQFVDFTRLFKPSMIGNAVNIAPFIKDKTLLQRAEAVQQQLAALSTGAGFTVQLLPGEGSRESGRVA